MKREISDLRNQHIELMRQKDSFLDSLLTATLSPEERAEVDLKLACLTGNIKRIDRTIHTIAFGGELTEEDAALSFMAIAEHSFKEAARAMHEEIYGLHGKVATLRQKVYNQAKAMRALQLQNQKPQHDKSKTFQQASKRS